MKIILIAGLLALSACTTNFPADRNEKGHKGSLTVIEPKKIKGLWLESKGEYESTFVYIENDTIYLLKGPTEKFYIGHDTLHLSGGGKFKRKIVEIDSAQLKWVTNSGETYTLYKKN